MTTLWIFFIILQVVSLGFCLLALWRLYHYIRRYKFNETQYTLLFGFIHLHWIALAYAGATAFWILASFYFYVRL